MRTFIITIRLYTVYSATMHANNNIVVLQMCRCLHISTVSDNLDLLAHVECFSEWFSEYAFSEWFSCSEIEHSDRVMV